MNLIYIEIFILVPIITYAWIIFSRKKGQLVKVNYRSSHQSPTAQGGGIAIVITSLLFVLITPLNLVSIQSKIFYLLPFFGVAIIGYIDDQYGLLASKKFLLLLIVSFLLVIQTPELFYLKILTQVFIISSWMLYPILLAGVMWLINLTNFIDGINGLVTLEAIFILVVTLLFKEQIHLQFIDFILIKFVLCACLAFLPFNFPKALVFLGDVGSLFLGALFAKLLIIYSYQYNAGFWMFLILFACFWVDATYTLIVRFFKKEKLFKAHRDHAYQHMANNYFKSHTKATMLIMTVNIFWLLPMAYWAARASYPEVVLIISIMPIVCYCYIFQAGIIKK